MIEQIEKMCSTYPFIPDRIPFCILGFMMLLLRKKCSNILAEILWKSLEIADVRAIGE